VFVCIGRNCLKKEKGTEKEENGEGDRGIDRGSS
jgi:hypothetical protein